MKTPIQSSLVVLAAFLTVSAQAQYITYSSYDGAPAYITTPVAYEPPVMYTQPVIYQSPVTYYGPVYYMNAPAPQYTTAPCEASQVSCASSTVFVMGGSRGSYGYANYGHCNPNLIIFGSRGGWFGR